MTPTRPQVNLLDSRAASEVKTRAKSARDLFVADHPEINLQTRDKLKADGVTAPKELQTAVNDAYTKAIDTAKADGSFATYEAAARADKETTAAARAQVAKGRTDVDREQDRQL